MASDCSQCQGEIDSTKYQCSWCSATNQCVHHDEPCLNRLSPGAKKCPPPSIVKIYPQAGPVNGGTVVTIEGIHTIYIIHPAPYANPQLYTTTHGFIPPPTTLNSQTSIIVVLGRTKFWSQKPRMNEVRG